MAGLLGDIFGAADTAKRKLRDVVANPLLSAQQFMGNMNDRARNLNEMTAAAAREGVDYGPASQRLGGLLADAYNPMGLTVFHGSPAKFNRFDPTKIGSGEGAQAYGYGHYVAESPETAKQYKETLKSKAFSKIVKKDRNVYDVVAPDGAVISQGTVLGAAHKAKDAYDANAGVLYEIDLPDEQIARMLDLDKPLSKQPQAVQSYLKDPYNAYRNQLTAQDIGGNEPTGSLILNRLQELMSEGRKADVFTNAENLGARNASQELFDFGIPGIRYLDEGSRSNFRVQNSVRGKLYGEPVSFMTEKQARDYAAEQAQKGFQSEIIPGTSNFVVFPGNENLLNIKKRNDDPLGLFD
jgi:hypothetical protein